MKVMWLNDSLVLRAENVEEKQALAVVFAALERDETEQTDNIEHCGTIATSID